MKDYVPANDPDGGGKKSKKAKKDPAAPKRNMSAYFLYSIAARPSVKEDNPEATFGEIARLISSRFKALSEKERKGWDEKAIGLSSSFVHAFFIMSYIRPTAHCVSVLFHSADKERYNAEMEDYKS